MKRQLVLLALLLSLIHGATANTRLTILSGTSHNDSRHLYERDLITLALEKTRARHGEFTLTEAPGMTHARGIESMRANRIPKFIRTFAFDPQLSEKYKLISLDFPIHRGITSYRTCLMSEKFRAEAEMVRSLDDLRKFSYGMGLGWTDTVIFRHNGFTRVKEVPNYDNLFKMAARGRIDFFCRGTNEILSEYTQFKHLKGLAHEKKFAIYYPIPILFYAHKSSQAELERLEEGIQIASKDGSLTALWQRYYQASIDFANLKSRKMFFLKSPLIDKIGFDYESAFFISPKSFEPQPAHSKKY